MKKLSQTVTCRRRIRRLVLTTTLLPAALAMQAHGVDWLGAATVAIDPTVVAGLQEGRVDANPFDLLSPNPGNGPDTGLGVGLSAGIRMGQSTLNFADASTADPDNFWSDDRTWIYTGEIWSGPTGRLSFAENIDDSVQIKIDGVVILQNGVWNMPTASGVLTFAPNTFHEFEVRLGNGVGGAGPVVGNNFTGTYGFGFSQTGATGTDGANYAAPLDPGTGTLFHYVTAPAADAGQDINVLGAANSAMGPTGANTAYGTTVTLSKVTNDHLTENSITFAPATGNVTTLTVNGSTPGGALRSLGTVLATSATKTVTITGDADFAPGALSTGPTPGAATLTGVILQKGAVNLQPGGAGPGALLLDNPTNALAGTTVKVFDGLLSVVGSGGVNTPISSLTTILEVVGNSAGTFAPVLRLGGGAVPTTFNNRIKVTNNGTIEHISPATDVIGGTTLSIETNRTVTFNVTGGGLVVGGTISSSLSTSSSGGQVRKLGAGTTLRLNGTTFVQGINAVDGRLEVAGQLRLSGATPTFAIGATATMALYNQQAGAAANQLPATLNITAGTLEGVPGAFTTTTGGAGSPSSLNLNGGNLVLGPGYNTTATGLIANLYTGSSGSAASAFNSYANYLNHFISRGTGTVTNTGANGVPDLAYGLPTGGDPAMFAPIAPSFTATNEIVSRFHGKILITNPGTYTFGAGSDDGSMIYIDQATIVSNNFSQAHTRRQGSVKLCAGLHDIDIGFYEGGGLNSLVVDWAGPGITGTETIPNSVLIPIPAEFDVYNNPLAVTQNAVINSAAASVPSVNLSVGRTLTVNGYLMKMGATTLSGGNGTYTINTVTQYAEVTASSITDAGAQITLVKNGPGMLVLEAGANPQLQGAGSSITATAGSLGLVLGPVSPTGNATINLTNGAGLTLSSKGGDQTMALPNFSNGGPIEARKLGSGVAGTVGMPIQMNLTGNFALNNGTTLNLSTRDNYVLNLGGVSGNATLNYNGGTIAHNAAINVGGPVNIACSVVNAASSVSSGAITVGDSTVTAGAVTSTGALNVANSTVTAASLALTGAMNLNTSTVTSNGSTSASNIAVNGSTFTSGGAIASPGGIQLTGNTGIGVSSTLNLNGGALTGGPITAEGGIIHVKTGVTVAATTATFTGSNPTGLRARYISTGTPGAIYRGQTESGILAIETLNLNQREKILTGPLSFLPYQAADATISAFFDGAPTEPTQFAIGFFGNFTAPGNGSQVFQMQVAQVDDDAGFWVDLDFDGVFEIAGANGNELIAQQACCGDSPAGNVTLIGGQTYKVGIAVEDGQGGSSIVGRIAAPGGSLETVDPSAASQAGWWSYGLPNQVIVDTGAELDIQAINGDVNVMVNGRLQFDGAGSSTIDSLTIGAGGIVEVGPGAPPAPAAGDELAGAAAVPEPGSLGLALLGALGLLSRRRR